MINLKKLKKINPKLEYVGARIDDETKKWLENHCVENGISVSTLIAALIAEYRSSKDRT
jgi:antitoxin component of RelBE/YafQ-DinJ toxin-antitoxin module